MKPPLPESHRPRSEVESLPEGCALPGRAPWSPATRRLDRHMVTLGRLLWKTGHRLGEVRKKCPTIPRASGEISFLTRASVTYTLNGRIVVDPTAAELSAAVPGDSAQIAPSSSKLDQFGEDHCPFPGVVECPDSPMSAFAGLVAHEIAEPCHGGARETTPLFCDAEGRAYTYAVWSGELFRLLRTLLGERLAQLYSWHSFRIGLACALSQAGCPAQQFDV